MAEEKANHFATCIGSSWIGVTTQGTAPRPSMAGSVDVPLFEDHLPPCIVVEGSGVGMSSGYLTAMRLRSHARSNSARLHVRLQDPGCSAAVRGPALSRGGLLDDIGVPAELITDRGSDEIGPIRIESSWTIRSMCPRST
jgi:hypothetical protein